MATMALQSSAPTRRGWGPFAVFRRGRTYLNLLYLLLALPLSYVYAVMFTNLLTGLVVSISIVALPLLVLVGAPVLAVFERFLAGGLLGVSFTPMAAPLEPDASLWDRLAAYLCNPVTWKSILYLIIYLIIRLPFGVIAFVLTLGLLSTALLSVCAPLVYLNAGGLAALHWGGWVPIFGYGIDRGPLAALSWLAALVAQFPVTPQGVALSLLITLLGVLALAGSLYALNGLAYGWGWFARQMLGVSPKDLQLAEARSIAAEARSIAAEARARADQAEHGRRQLILDASHELRTPVATIRAHIDSLLLLEGDQLPDKVRSYLAVTQREAARLSTLVDDLLMLARADADGLQLDVRPIPVAEVVEEVFRALEPLAERECQVTLVRNVEADLPPAYADRDRLAQVLLNLVRNAITYTPAGGLVSLDLTAGAEPGTLVLTVTDTGIGIPEDDIEHVFERFYRTDDSRARHTGGFGLGLSIVRDLVRAMGGAVSAERVPAGGSRFRVTLRAAPIPAQRP